ncbi:allophanate hydrolase [Paraburkholderia acidisoli]|uniref:Allophanate hydrolase n=1 Tax=Paraburkholderia acidisoli TaxID=2571748 RepID=A0A7Z2GK52_9BURK|nr:allophanate hydrolase [Paraburkholderia acidisoli]QGZ63297.1 allophanate hydrolase [Paraburkholderia acidisoli]
MPRTELLKVRALLDAYRRGETTPRDVVATVLQRLAVTHRPEAWILRVPDAALVTRAAQLEAQLAEEGPALLARLPLFGVPFAVKDNVDVAGLPTTAACPAFAYTPDETAFAVARLLEAGAILVGKTNLDQFATGLVGARSPYGAVRQIERDEYVSGGSSSGSAIAVAAGIVAFSLGTDTAGSGRVPAGFNGLVGLKPSLGLVSKRGVVPACRTLDTLSVFAHDVADAWTVLERLAAFDAQDGYAKPLVSRGLQHAPLRLAVPDTLTFFGDGHAADAFAATLDAIAAQLGLTPSTFAFAPLQQVAALLYDGPWVAERRAALGDFFETHRADLDPTVAKVIGQAARFDAAAAFDGQYALARLKREAEALFEHADVLIVPTTPTHPTLAEVQANPVEANSRLGVYTNFVNLLDWCALAVPGVPRADGLPAGVTLIARAGADQQLAVLGARIQACFDASANSRAAETIAAQPLPLQEPAVTLAVVGAHLRGEPLNWQLLQAGARFLEATTTAPHYRLYALAGTAPPKPGLVRVAGREGEAGEAIDIELWEVPLRTFGAFVAAVPAPLAIGSLDTFDGRTVKGFVCEPSAVAAGAGAVDITAYGGWRAYLAHHVAHRVAAPVVPPVASRETQPEPPPLA